MAFGVGVEDAEEGEGGGGGGDEYGGFVSISLEVVGVVWRVVLWLMVNLSAGATAFVKSVMLLSLGSKNFTRESLRIRF